MTTVCIIVKIEHKEDRRIYGYSYSIILSLNTVAVPPHSARPLPGGCIMLWLILVGVAIVKSQ